MAIHWIIFLISILPFWLLQNVIHELSHALTIFFGWKWKFNIWPFPSKRLGRFTFANVVYMPTSESLPLEKKDWALVSIMPRIINGVFVTISSILAMFLHHVSMIPTLLLVLFSWCNLVDYCFGMSSIFRSEPRETDIWKYKMNMEADISKMRFIASITMMFFTAIVVISIFQIFGV